MQFKKQSSTIEFLDKKDCCGCSSCVQKCPQKAIKLKENNEGFLYPVIDKKRCVNCGLCVKACPQFKKVNYTNNKYPKAYAMRNKNIDDLKASSSGGVFSVLANYVIQKNGIVFGAAYNKNLDVNHIMIECKENINLLRTSKYVQSNINNTYIEAENALKKGKYVLYTGTPCQIAGLNSYLDKEYDKLITVDLVCHGVPSQKLFHVYLDYLSNKFKSKVIEYNFRSKEKNGWGLLSRVKTQDGRIRFIEPEFDPYYSNFLKGTTYRMSCYQCHYANYNRVSNITLADYWGIEKIHTKFFKETGNSLILINDKKGEQIINHVKEEIELLSTNIDDAANNNRNLIKPSEKPISRDKIYFGLNNNNPSDFIKENLKIKVTIKKFIIKKMIPIKVKKILKKIKYKIEE